MELDPGPALAPFPVILCELIQTGAYCFHVEHSRVKLVGVNAKSRAKWPLRDETVEASSPICVWMVDEEQMRAGCRARDCCR